MAYENRHTGNGRRPRQTPLETPRETVVAKPSTQTAAVRAAIGTDTQHGAVVPPLYLSTNFSFAGFDDKREYDYTRSGNPTRDALADALSRLEGGAGAVVTASGMAAITLVCQLLQSGDTVIAPHDCYGGTHRLLRDLDQRGLFNVRFIDQTDPQAVESAVADSPALVWVETPSNPCLRITDIERIADLKREHGFLLAVDNTFLSPALQRPIELGADIVVHSTTKYLNGHSDVVGGAAIAATPALHEKLVYWANCLGLTGAPFDSFLTLRGVRTLHARMQMHQRNAGALATTLDGHPAVKRVYYPGLPGHPGHAVAARQQSGFGAMLSLELEGDTTSVAAFVGALELFTLAESLGGVESLVSHPATMTHAAMTAQARHEAGIPDTLVRLSAGIEDTDDLVLDVLRALEVATRTDSETTRTRQAA
ncbi:MAG: cystathionine gamma-synthase [Gammaproteobacteria bacterium]